MQSFEIEVPSRHTTKCPFRRMFFIVPEASNHEGQDFFILIGDIFQFTIAEEHPIKPDLLSFSDKWHGVPPIGALSLSSYIQLLLVMRSTVHYEEGTGHNCQEQLSAIGSLTGCI